MQKWSVRQLTVLGLLVGIEIVLSRFLSYSVWNSKIGLGFLPVVIAAMLYGPLSAGLVGALSDLLGALLFPVGAYFPGFTLTAFLSGLVFGLFLYQKRGFWRVLSAVLIHQFALGLLLNSLWISILYGSPYLPLLGVRVVQSLIMTALELACIPLAERICAAVGKQVRR